MESVDNDLLVSVCIPTRNRPEFLSQAIQSVLGQSYKKFELLIVDNASSAKTPKIVDSFKDNRMRYFRNNKDIGLVSNWNKCISLAKADYICIFHDDDLMLEDNLKIKMEFLKKNSEVCLLHSNINRIDQNNRLIGKHWAKRHKKDYISYNRELFMQLLLEDSPICSPTVIVKKGVFDKAGLFNPKLAYACDWEMWLKITLMYPAAYLAQPLINYRCHSEMLTEKYLRTRGLMQIYQAKKNILGQYKDLIENAGQLKKQVRNYYKGRALELSRRYFGNGKFIEAARSFLFGVSI